VRLAVYDLDGTILDGDSHALLLAGLVLRSPAGAGARARIVLGGLAWAARLADDDHTKRVAARAFAGWTREAMDAWVGDLVRRSVLPRVRPALVARLQEDRATGFTTVLLSASLEAPVQQVGRALGFDHAAGTRLAVADGVVTGRLDGEPLRGEAKARHLSRFAREQGADLARSRGYGDRASDRHFLSIVGEPCAVRPDRGLRRLALHRGWPILEG
jgi:HAD superfamily hydrolase (TIGR01490 family)